MTSKPTATSGEATAKTALAPGDVLGGKFRVERVVGRGGMGVVVEATNVQLDQKVALKLLATPSEDPAAVERFNREARAAARLRSEHVARVYDVGKDTLHGPFIVMEMLEGKTLADVLTSTGRVALHRAVEYIIDACEGLAEAHSRGIVHQDVKPANLFLVTGPDGRPSVKLLDFGIATIRSKEREADPKSSHPSLGTPAYLSPEQLRNSQLVDHRADIWSLGCVLYELLVGDRPFRAKRFTELVTKILETDPEPFPADLELPAPLAAIILRCLARDPAARYTSSAALALALLPYARPRAHLAAARAVAHVTKSGLDPELQMPESMPPAPSSEAEHDFPKSEQLRAPAVPRFSDEPGSAVSKPASESPRSRKVPAGLVAIALVVFGIAAFLTFHSDKPSSTAPLTTAIDSGAPSIATASASAPGPEPATTKASEPPVNSATATPSAATATQRHVTPPRPPKLQNTTPSNRANGESEIRFQR
jgi:serine/threonine-protein kinase